MSIVWAGLPGLTRLLGRRHGAHTTLVGDPPLLPPYKVTFGACLNHAGGYGTLWFNIGGGGHRVTVWGGGHVTQ